MAAALREWARSAASESRARGHPFHVWYAVLIELEVRGFTEDEELESIDLSVRRGVAEALDVGV
jgi:hypothetical protein